MKVIPSLKRTNLILLPKKSVETEAEKAVPASQFKMNFLNWKYKTLLNIRFECEHQEIWLRIISPVASILYSKLDYLKTEKGVKKLAI